MNVRGAVKEHLYFSTSSWAHINARPIQKLTNILSNDILHYHWTSRMKWNKFTDINNVVIE